MNDLKFNKNLRYAIKLLRTYQTYINYLVQESNLSPDAINTLIDNLAHETK